MRSRQCSFSMESRSTRYLSRGDWYIVELFFALEDGLFGLVGAPEQFPARKLGQDDVQFELVDDLLQFLVDVAELAVPQLGDFGVRRIFIGYLEHVGYFAIGFSLMVDYLSLEVDHQFGEI